MTDAQTWTLIAGFFTVMSVMIALTLRVVRAEISVLSVRLEGFEQRLEMKVDHLDRDVQTIVTRLLEG